MGFERNGKITVSSYISLTFAFLFLSILFALHFLKRELDPTWRMISEYEIGHLGWMMRLAFFCWGASVLALLIAIWPILLQVNGAISRWWFSLIVITLFGAGIFKTDPITSDTHSLVNTIHKICGTIVILTFPIAASLAVSSLLHNNLWSAYQDIMIFGVGLTWIGMLVYFGTIVISRVKDPKSGEIGGPHILMGWPNRFNVVTYLVWIVIMATVASRI